MGLQKREDVSVELTWDVTHLFATEDALWEAEKQAIQLANDLNTIYKGKLTNPEIIDECVTKMQELEEKLDHIASYAGLVSAVDYTNDHNQEIMAKISREHAELYAKVSFIESEVSEVDEEILKQSIEIASGNKGYFKKLLKFKPHRLGAKTEETLTRLSGTLNAPYEMYHIVKLSDMKFDSFTVDGKDYPLGYSLFEDDYEYDERTEVRREAFREFSNKLKQYENITAAIYDTQVQKEKTISKIRGFESVFDSMLFSQDVPREMYDRQIDVIMEQLAPHMRKYAKLLQRIHGLDQMTFADLKIPVDSAYNPKIGIQEAKEYLTDGLSPLGDEYVQMVRQAFEERWIDFAKNEGKETGGFCSSPYRKHSYILMTWNDRMSDVLTLAHELGHAGHFKASSEAQSLYDTYDQMYISEAPSTTNELIMAHYLLKSNPDKRFRRWLLSCMITNTYYHNFVTHLLEAAYQREVYKIVDEGGSVHAETLNRIMRETLERFWGDAVVINEGAELTWMRQPHYYMQLYSYTYSAGLTIGTQVCKRIEEEGEVAVNQWKEVLTKGGTLGPVEFAKAAGVDITTKKSLEDTIAYIGAIIDEIIQLTNELEEG